MKYEALFTGTLDGCPVGLYGTKESVEALERFIAKSHTLGEPVVVPDDMVERLRIAARALVRESKVYAEDVETIGDVVKLLESFVKKDDDFDPFTAIRDAVLKAMPHTDDLSIRKTRKAQTWQQVLNNIDLLGHYAKENAAPHHPTTEKGCE